MLSRSYDNADAAEDELPAASSKKLPSGSTMYLATLSLTRTADNHAHDACTVHVNTVDDLSCRETDERQSTGAQHVLTRSHCSLCLKLLLHSHQGTLYGALSRSVRAPVRSNTT